MKADYDTCERQQPNDRPELVGVSYFFFGLIFLVVRACLRITTSTVLLRARLQGSQPEGMSRQEFGQAEEGWPPPSEQIVGTILRLQ